MKKILILPYSAEWPKRFREIRDDLSRQLDGLFESIQHVGSTSIPGLSGKPILDIDVIIPDVDKLSKITSALAKIGYVLVGERGIPGRYAFERFDHFIPEDQNKSWMAHHLYVCLAGSDSLDNHLKFRDFLRSNPWAVNEYAKLKRRLATVANGDIDRYVSGKSQFISMILKKQGIAPAVIETIAKQNAFSAK